MKKTITKFMIAWAVMLLTAATALADAPTNYYNNAMGKSDEALMTALKNIIYSHTALSYSGLWNAFKTIDTDDQGYIIDMYSDYRYLPSEHGASASGIGEGYNREHSFPKSWFDDDTPMYTDLFHIYPTDISVNSQRSNYPFGVCENGTRIKTGNYTAKGRRGTSTYSGYSGIVFEPDDEYKGDFARSYFYMVTCYKDQLPSWPGSAQLDYSTNKYKAFSTWSINLLMEWHRLDPVSDKETKRNDAVYSLQGNRNPFIDHPELAEYIWGNMQGQSWNGSESVDPAITAPADGATLDMGTTTVGEPITLTVTVKGEGLSQALTMSMSDNEYFYVSNSTFTASAVNSGTTFTITFTGDDEGSFSNQITIASSEVSTTFTVTAAAQQGSVTPDPEPSGDAIIETWEGCSSGGYWTLDVDGAAWVWAFYNAGLFAQGSDKFNDEMGCRFGKKSNSSITMQEDVTTGTSGISFYAATYYKDDAGVLQVDYSTDAGTTWNTLGSVTLTTTWTQYAFGVNVEGRVRFRLVQTAGARLNVDDIAVYARSTTLVGDVNNDGEVTIADVNAIIDIILGGDADDATRVRADVNGDGEVTIADVNAVIDIILGNND